MRYGLKLKLYRERLGLTQKEVADAIGIGRNSLSRYENGDLKVPLTVFIALARLYKCDVFDIMGVRDPQMRDVIEFDVNVYYLIKAHAYYLVSSEKEVNESFGTIYSNEYYNLRFREKIKEMLENRIYLEHFTDLEAQEDIDTLDYFE